MGPQEQGFRRQVAIRPGAPLPRVSPAAFGAELAQELGRTAQVAQREGLENIALDRRATQDRETTDFHSRFANGREEDSAFTVQSRSDGFDGHGERVARQLAARREKLLEGITEDEVRNNAVRAFDNYAANVREREMLWQEGQRIEKSQGDFVSARNVSANRSARLEDPKDYLAETAIQHDAIDALNIPRDAKEALRKETDQVMAVAFLQGRIDADPTLAKGLMAGGAFDDVLTPQQMVQLGNAADVEIGRAEVAARRKAAEQEAALRESIQVLEEADRQGIELPAEQFDAAIAGAQALGDQSLALKLDGLKANRDLARIWGNGNATPAQRAARVAELAGLDKRTPAQDIELKYLRDKGGALDTAFEADPAKAVMAQSGAPPVDLADPASLAARMQWSREQSAAAGRYVPPLAKAETGPMRDLFKRGQFKQVFDLLDNFDARARQEVAAMIAPEDVQFQETAPLFWQYRDWITDGRAVLKDKPKILKSEDFAIEQGMLAIEAEFDHATRNMDPAQRQAIRANAKALMAARVNDGAFDLTPARLRDSFQRALGMRGARETETGGMKRWGGTGEWFIVPEGLTQQAFGNAVFGFLRDNPARAPRNRDGSVLDLKALTPVAIGDDFYEFHSPNGQVARGADGGVFKLRVRPARAGGGQ